MGRNWIFVICMSTASLIWFIELAYSGGQNDVIVQNTHNRIWFIDKAEGEGVYFVEIDGDLKSRYKDKYGSFVQLSMNTSFRSKFNSSKDYPIANFVRPKNKVKLQNGFTATLRQLDLRAHTSCPRLYNNYIELYDQKSKKVSEIALLYRPVRPITGTLVDCPNSVSEKHNYVSDFVTLGEGFIYVQNQKSSQSSTDRLWLIGGSQPHVVDTVVEIAIEQNTVSGSSVQLLIRDYCDRDDIYKYQPSKMREAMRGEELNYQDQFDKIRRNVEMEKQMSCQ